MWLNHPKHLQSLLPVRECTSILRDWPWLLSYPKKSTKHKCPYRLIYLSKFSPSWTPSLLVWRKVPTPRQCSTSTYHQRNRPWSWLRYITETMLGCTSGFLVRGYLLMNQLIKGTIPSCVKTSFPRSLIPSMAPTAGRMLSIYIHIGYPSFSWSSHLEACTAPAILKTYWRSNTMH